MKKDDKRKKPQPRYPDAFDVDTQNEWATNAAITAQGSIVKELQAAGVNYKVVAKALKEQLEAMETKLFAHQGVVMSSVDLINYAARAEGIKLYLSITGAVAPKQEKVEHAGVIVYKPDPRIQKKVPNE